MRPGPFNLAIETSTRAASLCLGRGDEIIAAVDLPPQRRHRVGLLPGLAALCREHDVTPDQLGELYVSLGPGSFTGLRVAMASVKMLALAHPLKLVGVPTLNALAQRAPADARHVAVCLNLKRETMWCGLFERRGGSLSAASEPALRTMDELLAAAPRPVAVLGDPLPARSTWPEDVRVLPAELARPEASAVWRVGRAMAARGAFVEPAQLAPIYARPPEAVQLWNERHGTPS